MKMTDGGPEGYQETSRPTGIKESNDKLFYELDFRFIEAMAKRMADNKGSKYPTWNWKKPIDIEGLSQANFRHTVEVMDGNYSDGDKEFDHVVALACNAMMIWYQLKHHNGQEAKGE